LGRKEEFATSRHDEQLEIPPGRDTGRIKGRYQDRFLRTVVIDRKKNLSIESPAEVQE